MYPLPEAKARELLRKLNAKNPERIIDIEAVANAVGLIVKETDAENSEGYSVRTESSGLIKVSASSKEPGQRRFTIAHEIGHFLLDKNPIHLCRMEDMVGYKSKKEEENAANAFAAELLMKKEWYAGFVKDKAPGIETIKQAAEYFGVSLSASAIRYSQAGNFPVAVIMSCKGAHNEGRVSWSAISESFPYRYVGKGYKVNKFSEADKFFSQGSGKKMDLKPHRVLADSWFSDTRGFRPNHYLVEQCLPMPNYDCVLTVVWQA